MNKYEIDIAFKQLVGPLKQSIQEDDERAKREAFKPESRPLPEGLIPKGIPLGHIALRGDFDMLPNQL